MLLKKIEMLLAAVTNKYCIFNECLMSHVIAPSFLTSFQRCRDYLVLARLRVFRKSSRSLISNSLPPSGRNIEKGEGGGGRKDTEYVCEAKF